MVRDGNEDAIGSVGVVTLILLPLSRSTDLLLDTGSRESLLRLSVYDVERWEELVGMEVPSVCCLGFLFILNLA